MTLRLFVLAALLITTPTFAQTPSDESVNKLIQLTESEKVLEINHEVGIQAATEAIWQQALPQPKMGDQTQRNQIIDIVDEFQENVKKRIFSPSMREAELNVLRRALKQNYTQEEIDAQLQFYSTPIGRQIIAKQAVYVEQTARDLAELTQKRYAAAIEAELPQSMAKFQALNAKKSPKATTKSPKKTSPKNKQKAK
ncbi:DUF2059 domain-containing protein [Alysiella crassa]|uniref:Uncharacterized protein conserved in bacteria n=1 Tax=Alysiella crassa TaxID=153491 RepID=A0A376BW39_9NEIS|nr:DUF2059 domain-containing protein [Alysiella crassa]UOP06481.1 DUF2059 domain-containing protein [Alysiella crassa]SSY81013.1 Uncharacterized protein conserved in bacteria [Alysiella crassa]